MDPRGSLDRDQHARRDADWLHQARVEDFSLILQKEPEYRDEGHGSVLLARTDQLRVVLEVARAGAAMEERTTDEPALLYVIEGALELDIEGERRLAGSGEMAVIPRGRARILRAIEPVSLLWVFALDRPSSIATGPARGRLRESASAASGITRRAPAEERRAQARVPARGAKKGEVPPPQFDASLELYEWSLSDEPPPLRQGLGKRPKMAHAGTGRARTRGARSGHHHQPPVPSMSNAREGSKGEPEEEWEDTP